MLVLGTSLLALLLALRAVRVGFGEGWHESQAIAPDIQAMTYFVVLAVLLLNTTGYLLMHMECAIELQRSAATHDALTGALSRRPLREAFEQGLALALREGQAYAVLMLDLDRFKRVNDEHGHQAGDAVLQQFAQRIAQRLRRHDRLGRYGGEEFLVLLPGTDRPGACAVAEELRRVIEERPFTFGSARIPVTVSVGVCARGRTDAGSAGAPAPQAQVERMIADADRALYAAKRNGRNRVEVAD
jgi:diguanylate cyclase (GGDEF)-like protein